MSNSNLFGIGLGGLNAAQMGLTTTGNNISNQATPGYTLERVEYAEASGQYTGSGYIGGGVNTVTVQREYNQYLTTELNNAQSQYGSLQSNFSLVSQLNNLVGDPTGGIGAAMTNFFNGLSTVANNANDSSARASAVSDAQQLVDLFNQAGQQYDQLRQSVNTQLSGTVSQINGYTKQIAQLNTEIAAASAGGQPPNQLLDQRDQAVSSLSQLIGVSVVQDGSGNYTVLMGNGQPLVMGSKNYQLTTESSDSNPGELEVAYQSTGADPGQTVTSRLPDSAVSGGQLGGLLTFRSQTLDPAEAQLGAIATSFAAQLNAQNEAGIDQSGQPGGALFDVADPTVYASGGNTGSETLAATLADPQSPPTDPYTLSFDGTNYTLTDAATGTVVQQSTTAPDGTAAWGGFNLTLSGPMTAGDSFRIDPTSGALDSIKLATQDGADIAAGSAPSSTPFVSAPQSNQGTATISLGAISGDTTISSPITLTYDADDKTLSGFPPGTTITVGDTTPPTTVTITSTTDTVPYDPANGDTYTIESTTQPPPDGAPNDIAFTIAGKPKDGDQFEISQTGGVDDGSNAAKMADIANATAFDNGGKTLTDAYAGYVDNIGNTANQLQSSSNSQSALVTQITQQQQSASGVNLDEEATNLLQYQQLYQANSKVIQTAESLFQSLISIFQ